MAYLFFHRSARQILQRVGRMMFGTSAAGIYQVPNDSKSLSQLVEELKSKLPATSIVYMCARNARDDLISARIYTDGWPNFSTTVCQILKPKVSEVSDLVCYSTSMENQLSVLLEADVLTWGKWQMIDGVNVSHAKHLMETLRMKNVSSSGKIESRYEGSLFVYPHVPEAPTPPKGFMFNGLNQNHVKYLVDDMPGYRERGPDALGEYFNDIVRNFHTVGIFKNDDYERPVAWMYVTAYGGGGWHYVSKEYRGMGFSIILRLELARQVRAGGGIAVVVAPETFVDYALQAGATEAYRTQKLFLTE